MPGWGPAPEPTRSVYARLDAPPTSLRQLRAAIARAARPAALLEPGFGTTALAILLAALAGAFTPWTHLELRAAGGHEGLAVAFRLLSALACVFIFDCFWRHPRVHNLLLACALAIVAASDLVAVALLVCAWMEWTLQERHAAAAALTRERRRMAADVHDLIMQDLSFALANARTLVDDPARAAQDPARAAQASTVVSASERALAGARDVVSGLTEHDTRPIAQAVEASVRAAARHTPLAFRAERVPPSTELDKHTRDALVHIAREAVTNAVKHARASTVEVVLERAGQWRLTVRDDGRGFDEALAGEGFGLLSMRQSAHAVGGAVHVSRAGGGGTTVEAVLP